MHIQLIDVSALQINLISIVISTKNQVCLVPFTIDQFNCTVQQFPPCGMVQWWVISAISQMKWNKMQKYHPSWD